MLDLSSLVERSRVSKHTHLPKSSLAFQSRLKNLFRYRRQNDIGVYLCVCVCVCVFMCASFVCGSFLKIAQAQFKASI